MLGEADRNELIKLLMAAEPLRAKLLSILSLGPVSLEAQAYAVKARVKAFDRAEEKILKKRNGGDGEDARPDYGPSTLTDIIGIRILCLYPDDISTIFTRLIDTMRAIASTELSPFAGRKLADIISEVIVYKAPNSPAIYDVIKDHITRLLESEKGMTAKVRDKASPKEKPYSSVHMVFWCITQSGREALRIPVEVQVRTSLEDVWCEVDHRLKYKAEPKPGHERERQRAYNLLNALKGQLDSAATIVTEARDMLSGPPPDSGLATSRYTDMRKDPVLFWGLTGANAKIKKAGRDLLDYLEEFYEDFEKSENYPDPDWNVRFSDLEGRIDEFVRNAEADQKFLTRSSQYIARWRFSTQMETAQILFWRARLGRLSKVCDDARSAAAESIDSITDRCLKIYLLLLEDDANHGYAMLWFRFGNALLELKLDFSSAVAYLQRANEKLKDDPTISRESPFRSVIPRLYAYCVWRLQHQRFHETVSLYGHQSVVAAHVLKSLSDAVNVMQELVPLTGRLRAESGLWDAELERLKVLNNLVSYAWDYALRSAEATGSDLASASLQARLEDVLSSDVLNDAYQGLVSLAAADDKYGGDLDLLHTLMIGAYLTGDDQRLLGFVHALRNRMNVETFAEDDESAILRLRKLNDDLGIIDPQQEERE